LGGFRTFPTGVAEDADFFYRIRKAGGRVVLDPLIISSYQPRTGWRSLFRQFRRYGQGKAEMFWANGEFPSWRPLAPLGLVVAILAASLTSALAARPWPLAVVVGSWLISCLLVFTPSGTLALLAASAAAVMQFAYGIGLAWGLLRGPQPVMHLRSAAVGGVVPPLNPAAEHSDGDP
jgi:succinoglycan biosynthesis protein ExoA